MDSSAQTECIHLLKLKSQALSVIEEFVHMVSTQYNKKVKKVRSDNAWEVDDKKCKVFYAKLGILHETSCVDTLEQNGRTERRHINLLEMGRALRYQSGLPLQY